MNGYQLPQFGESITDDSGARWVLLGAPGSGKGTQAKLLKQFLLEHTPDTEVFAVETGQHFRQIMSESGYTSEKIRESINRGDLQPDWLPSWLFVNSFVEKSKTLNLLLKRSVFAKVLLRVPS